MARINLILSAVLVVVIAAGSYAAEKLNILFVVVDDLKPTIGCYGDAVARTPNLDRLGARGMVFDRAYCLQAVCAPSRNATLTGLRPEVLRIYDLGTNFRRRVPDVVTLPQWFKQNGWKAEGIGKIYHVGHGNHEDPASWTVPHWPAKTIDYVLPENRAKGLTREEALFGNSSTRVADLPRGAPFECADVPDNAYGDGKIADEAVARLRAARANAGQPFFIAVGFLKPHLPFCAPRKYWDMYDPAKLPMPDRDTPPDGAPKFAPTTWGELRQYSDIPDVGPVNPAKARQLIHGYYAATSYMDAQFGRVLDELDALGLSKNTVIVLWGDNGWHLGDHGMWSKHTNYEQATRVPLIFSAPGHRGGQHTASLVELTDIYPTLCDLAGAAKPAHLQGTSLVPVLDDAKVSPRAAAFQVFPRGTRETGPMLGQAVRTERWRYIEWRKADSSAAARELYDMQNDPGETVNLADTQEQKAAVAELEAMLNARLSERPPEGLKMVDPAKAQAAQARAALFDHKDTNHDGILTREEFMAGQPDPEQAAKRFEKFDVNKDGVLSREEFINMGATGK
ncbi:MAG: sulfatase-like hydrolase/transferase [Tepidisphaeraceae bacterium]|jgi:iduronate 2-sulfatase